MIVGLDSGEQMELPDGTPPEGIDDAISHYKSSQSPLGQAKQWAGLTYRNAIEGATALPDMIGNIPIATANAVTGSYNYLTGGNAQHIPYSHPFKEGLSALEVPQPQTPAQRLYGDITKPIFGVAAGGAGAANLVANGGKAEALLASNLPLQYQAAIGGGAAGGITREMDGSPAAQTVASLAGSIGTPTAWSALKGVAGAVTPFTQSGRDQITANTLASYADNPQQAAVNLNNAQTLVAGSSPTTGVASGDYGLIKLEKGLQREEPFTDEIIAQNKARNNLLSSVAGTPADVDAAIQARKVATEPLYQQAGQQQLNPRAITPVLTKIDEQLAQVGAKSDAGKTLLDLKSKIQSALPSMTAKDTGILDASGAPISTPIFSNTTQAPLVQIFKETRDNLIKKAEEPGAYGSTVKGVIQPINMMLGDALEAQSPILAQANKIFKQLSVPINQMQTMQDIYKGMQGTQQDVEGNFFLQPAAASKLIKNGEVNTPYFGWQPLHEALSPQQYDALLKVQQDMSRSNLINSPGVKAVGSETFQNLASANALNKATGGAINIGIPGTKWLYEKSNPQVRENLIEAMKNPQKAAQLLQQGIPNSNTPFLPQAMNNFMRAAYAGQLYNQ